MHIFTDFIAEVGSAPLSNKQKGFTSSPSCPLMDGPYHDLLSCSLLQPLQRAGGRGAGGAWSEWQEGGQRYSTQNWSPLQFRRCSHWRWRLYMKSRLGYRKFETRLEGDKKRWRHQVQMYASPRRIWVSVPLTIEGRNEQCVSYLSYWTINLDDYTRCSHSF